MQPQNAQLQAELEARLAFEMLIADLSLGFVNIPTNHIDETIGDAQQRVCRQLDLDLSSMWQLSPESPRELILTHVYRPAGGPSLPVRMGASEYFPWCLGELAAGRLIVCPSIEDTPGQAARDREMWRHYGIKSNLSIPLATGGGPLIGVLSFSQTRFERPWPEPLVKRLQLIAGIFASVLARKEAEESLRQSEQRLSLATEAAGAGLWILDLRSLHYWLTPKTREIFAFAADEDVSFDRFMAAVHPDDHNLIRATVAQLTRSGEEGLAEYRVLQPDGGVKWIASRGRRHCDASGTPVSLMGVSIDVTPRKQAELSLKAAYEEIGRLKDQLQRENIYLREGLASLGGYGRIVGDSPGLRATVEHADQVAGTDSTVLILGETGTGKELLAHHIHAASARNGKALITTNLAAMPATLIESELFGREKGAYTGALTRQIGRFELADGGTIFLDEIGEMSPETQAKLLRVLQDGSIERLGSSRTIHVDCRVIAATNRDLLAEVEAGRFREDLYYRLNVFPIVVPPLRERVEDIPLLTWTFVKEFSEKMGKPIQRIRRQDMAALQGYSWPGNVRELRNVIERSMILTRGVELHVVLPKPAPADVKADSSLARFEREHIITVLQRSRGRIRGQGGAAEMLGIKPSTLYFRMKKLGIDRNMFPSQGRSAN